ncbi:hypothetical protein MMC13_007769 [Lambiella insularis]|nr:hypothetical protein [Lambiella insularis]
MSYTAVNFKDFKKRDRAVKNEDFKKFSTNFQLLTPAPKDLIPILSNDKTKQDEIGRLNKRKNWKSGMPLAQHNTKTWVPDPEARTFIQPWAYAKNHSEQLQKLEDPAIVRVRLPPSSGDLPKENAYVPHSVGNPLVPYHGEISYVPHDYAQRESSTAPVCVENEAPLRPVQPPASTTWSQIVRRRTVNDVHKAVVR